MRKSILPVCRPVPKAVRRWTRSGSSLRDPRRRDRRRRDRTGGGTAGACRAASARCGRCASTCSSVNGRDRGRSPKLGQFVQDRPQPGLDDAADQFRRRRFQAQRLDGAVARARGSGCSADPECSRRATGTKRFHRPRSAKIRKQRPSIWCIAWTMPAKNASAVRWASSVRRASSRSSSWSKATTTGIFRPRKTSISTLNRASTRSCRRRPDLEVQLGEAVGQEVGEVGFVAEQGGPGEALVRMCRRIRPAVLCASVWSTWAHDEVAGLLRVEPGLGQRLRQRHRRPAEAGMPARWSASHWRVPAACVRPRPSRRAQRPRPGAGTGRPCRRQSGPASAAPRCRRTSSSPTYSSGRDALLLAAAEQRVDDLEEQIFEEIGVLLVGARRDEQLPGPPAPCLIECSRCVLPAPLLPRTGTTSECVVGS